MIALIALMFFSMYRLNPNVQRPKELTQIEFFKAVDDGKIVEPITRYLDRDEGETYLTGEVETDELDENGDPKREIYRVSLVPGENEGLMNDLFNAQMKVVVKEKKSLMSPFVAQLVFFLGFMAFVIASSSGVLFVKLFNLVLPKEKNINPLIGNAGVSAVPMSARISNNLGLEYDPQNYLLMHAMGPNVAGVIGSAVAAGVLLGFLA